MKPDEKTPEQRSLEFLSDSDRWPNWPLCPVKKSPFNPSENYGLVVESGLGVLPVVVLCNLWRLKEDFDTAKKIEYASLAAMVEDGWVVD